MKNLVLIFIIPVFLFGAAFDPALLQIGAKIFPKTALMEKGTHERIQSSVNFVIVTSSSNKSTAQRLSEIMEHQYNGTLSTYPLNLFVVSPKEALEIKNAHGFILLMDPDDSFLPLVLEYAEKTKTLTFSFDPLLLQKGVAVSLYIGRNVKPYINLITLKQVPFTFEYGFLKLSQPY